MVGERERRYDIYSEKESRVRFGRERFESTEK